MMSMDYDRAMEAQERLADKYTAAELVDILSIDVWDLMDVIWEAIMDHSEAKTTPEEILEAIGIE